MNTQKNIVWSDEQKAIFAWAKKQMAGIVHLIISALAGTGKTFTSLYMILQSAELLAKEPVLLVTFMVKNREDAQRKIAEINGTCPPNLDIKGWGQIGFALLKSHFRFFRIGDFAEWSRLQKVCPDLLDKQFNYLNFILSNFIAYCKNVFPYVPTEGEVLKLINEMDIAANAKDSAKFPPEKLAEIVCGVMAMHTRTERNELSAADLTFLPHVLKLVKPCYKLIVIDEAQDTNRLQFLMAKALLLPGGRIVACGDENQAMYSWRGAMPDSMATFEKELGAGKLGLTVTYRCGANIVKEAQTFVPDYKAHESNEAGEIKTCDDEKMLSLVKIGDAILSRTNAPLMKHALALIRKNIPAKIEGKEIADDLIRLVENVANGIDDIATFDDKLAVWEQTSIAKVSPNSFTATQRIEQIQDKAATLRVLSEVATSVSDMVARLEYMFQNSASKYAKPCVVLSTVHKAKGLEWDNVFMLMETFGRTRATATEAQRQEERNIQYVAITRARKTLHEVTPKP